MAPDRGKDDDESWVTWNDLDGSRQVRLRLPEQDGSRSDLPSLSAGGSRAIFLFRGALWTIDLGTGISRKTFAPPGSHLSWVSVSQDLKRILYRSEVVPGVWEEGLYLLDLE